MFQIFLNLIFAVSPKCDTSKAAVALLPLVKRATSHPGFWLQMEILPKQKHWLGKFRYDKDPFTTRIRFLHCKGCSSSKQKKKKKGVMDQTPLSPLMHGYI